MLIAESKEIESSSFSVVIPLYNNGEYISRALESVYCQTVEPGEVIVIDDGSTDGGADVVRAQYPQVRLFQQTNMGVGRARNAGIGQASSEWIALLDADDYWLPNHLEELERIVERYPDADLISTRWAELDHGLTTTYERAGGEAAGHIEDIDYFAVAARRGGPVWTSSSAINHETFRRFGGFGFEPVGQDLEYWVRIALRGKVATSSAVTAIYVRGTGGVIETRKQTLRPYRSPATYGDISPALKTIEESFSSGDYSVPHESVLAYVNARIADKMYKSIMVGDIGVSRDYRRFLSPPLNMKLRAIVCLTFLPDWASRFSISMLRRIRSQALGRERESA